MKSKPMANDADDTADVLAKIDSKTKQIDALLAGFDDNNQSLTFIPSSIKQSSKSCAADNGNRPTNSAIDDTDQVTKTITITATSFKVEHHDESGSTMSPSPSSSAAHVQQQQHVLRPLPSLDAQPQRSILRQSNFVSFRDEKKSHRRSSRKEKEKEKDANALPSSSSIVPSSDDGSSKKVCFDSMAKGEDGISAKLYGSPGYCIREGTYLRPKPREQIENEKRLLTMLGAPSDLSGRALPVALLQDDWEEEYDPQIPNDYGAFVDARVRLQEWTHIRMQQREFAYQCALRAEEKAQQFIESEIKREKELEKKRERDRDRAKDKDRDKDKDRAYRDRGKHRSSKRSRDRERERSRSRSRDGKRSRNSREQEKEKDREYGYLGALPTQSPLEAMHVDLDTANRQENSDTPLPMSGIDKARKMMAKFGWKSGDGLGKSKQGLKGCLVPIGGYNQLMSLQDPTNVLLLQNMANKGAVDEHLQSETVEECQNFGPVLGCVIHETSKRDIAKEQAVSVFVKFEHIASCCHALQTFNGRFFDGRRVIASFFPNERFDAGDLDP